jgi:hypothetical protein
VDGLSRQALEAADCWEADDKVPGRPQMTKFPRRLRYRNLLADQSTFFSVTVEELLDADVLRPQTAAALPTIRAINPRTWIKRTNYRELEFLPSLRSFDRQRADLLAALEPLPPEGWSRSATVTGAGAVLQRTVLTYVQARAVHERQHHKQIQRIVSALPRK